MDAWKHLEIGHEGSLARLHYFSVIKKQASGEIEFQITVRESAKPATPDMLFFAEADKETNQRVAPYRPSGWSNTLEDALRLCILNLQRFDYEPSE